MSHKANYGTYAPLAADDFLPVEPGFYTEKGDWLWKCMAGSCGFQHVSHGLTSDDVADYMSDAGVDPVRAIRCPQCKERLGKPERVKA